MSVCLMSCAGPYHALGLPAAHCGVSTHTPHPTLHMFCRAGRSLSQDENEVSATNNCYKDLKFVAAYRLEAGDDAAYSNCDANRDKAMERKLCIETLLTEGSFGDEYIAKNYGAYTAGVVPDNSVAYFDVYDTDGGKVDLTDFSRVYVDDDLNSCDPYGMEKCNYWFPVSLWCSSP